MVRVGVRKVSDGKEGGIMGGGSEVVDEEFLRRRAWRWGDEPWIDRVLGKERPLEKGE